MTRGRICSTPTRASAASAAAPTSSRTARAACGALDDAHAREILRTLARFPEVLEKASAQREPSVVSHYVLELARAFHASYKVLRVRGVEPELARARLRLFDAVQSVLGEGLRILGLDVLERM